MKLKFIKAEETGLNAKAAVHTTGKLGFSKDAIDFLGITEGSTIEFAVNDEDNSDINLYAKIYNEVKEGAFRVSKAGEYYYVNTKKLFDAIEIDYRKIRIIYDLVKIDYEGEKIIKMIRRDIIKKPLKDMPT
jgi:hypothetical protein